MINPDTIEAVRKKVSEISGIPTIKWPNESIDVAAPYMVWDNGFQTDEVLTIDGMEVVEWRPQLSILTPQGSATHNGLVYLWIVAQEFKVGTRILSSGGDLLAKSQKTPTADNGSFDQGNGLYRQNLSFQLLASHTIGE